MKFMLKKEKLLNNFHRLVLSKCHGYGFVTNLFQSK